MFPTKRPNQKYKTIVIIALGVILALVTAAIIWWIAKPIDGEEAGNESKSESLETAEVNDEIPLTREEATNNPMEDINISDMEKEKEYYVDYVDYAAFRGGDGVYDIHIRFPDGEDYVVVAGKNIVDVTDEGFYIKLNDRENHMLSSARTDKDVYNGTQMYLSRYEIGSGIESQADYPWNQFVLGVHGIEEDEASMIYARRIQLEENLATFMNQTLSK